MEQEKPPVREVSAGASAPPRAPGRAGGGLLPHLRRTRQVTHEASPHATPGAVLDAVAQELHRRGHVVRVVSATRLEFGSRAFGFSQWQDSSVVVSGGAVTVDPRAREPIRLEVRLEPWFTYVVPSLVSCVVLAWEFFEVSERAALLGLIWVGALAHAALGVEAYQRWIKEAAKRV